MFDFGGIGKSKPVKWKVRTWLAFLLWAILGGAGAHRFYAGHWRIGLLFLTYSVGTGLIEEFILYPHLDMPLSVKENISIITLVLLWGFLIWDLIKLRLIVESANPTETLEDTFS